MAFEIIVNDVYCSHAAEKEGSDTEVNESTADKTHTWEHLVYIMFIRERHLDELCERMNLLYLTLFMIICAFAFSLENLIKMTRQVKY